jgi:protein-disulfide isomerase
MTSRLLHRTQMFGLVTAIATGIATPLAGGSEDLAVQQSCPVDSGPLAACVNGSGIPLKDVDDRAGKMFVRSGGTLDEVIYDARQAIVEAVISDLLIKHEAQRTRRTPEEVLAPYLATIAASKTDSSGQPTAPTARQAQQLARIRAFVASLRDKASIEMYLTPPRHAVPVAANDQAVGGEEAPLQLIVFTDFECPYCAQLMPVLKALRSRFEGEMRIVHKDFPLISIHKHAQAAAEAARCAGDQDDYWSYHDLLFSGRAALDEDALLDYARQLALDVKAFGECLRTHRFAAAVQKDARDARALGLDSTPVSFLNGRKILGALDLDAFTRLAEQELALTRHNERPQER